MKKTEDNKLRESLVRSLSYERISRGITQQEIADKLGTSKSSISRLESGNQNITIDYVQAYTKALGLKAELMVSEPDSVDDQLTEYDLKLYDDILVSFTLQREYDIKCEITYINHELKHLFPIGLKLSGSGIIKWLRDRSIPSNRAYVIDILDSLNLDSRDVKGFVDICMGLSLNDSYWVSPKGFNGSFAEYNLYENQFDETLSLVAYIGGDCKGGSFRSTPELTTNGMLRKAWRRNDDGIWLYKGGSTEWEYSGNEPFCEFYASQIAQRMGLNAIKYELIKWTGINTSRCKLFTDIDTSFVPIGKITKCDIDDVIEYYKKLGDDFYSQLASMLVFDAVIYNPDRHFGNFGLLRDNHSGEFIGPAPIFDNGCGLLAYSTKPDYTKLDKYIKSIHNPYGAKRDFISLAKQVLGPKQREELKGLIGFRFDDATDIAFPNWRLKALEELIQKRIKELLSL